jgi:hypothetical protein
MDEQSAQVLVPNRLFDLGAGARQLDPDALSEGCC